MSGSANINLNLSLIEQSAWYNLGRW
jgi:hypothetical protein